MKVIIEDNSGNMKVIVDSKSKAINNAIEELKSMAEYEKLRNKQSNIMSEVVIKEINQLIDYLNEEEGA